jgi:hypothetical protein
LQIQFSGSFFALTFQQFHSCCEKHFRHPQQTKHQHHRPFKGHILNYHTAMVQIQRIKSATKENKNEVQRAIPAQKNSISKRLKNG